MSDCHNEMSDGDVTCSEPLSLELLCSLLQVVGCPVRGVRPVLSTILSRENVKNPDDGVVIGIPVAVLTTSDFSRFNIGREVGRKELFCAAEDTGVREHGDVPGSVFTLSVHMGLWAWSMNSS